MSNPQVELHVTINVADTATPGVITLELDNAKAPKSTANFLNYVNKGHYDGTIFHRVIKGFMIQGGGFTPDTRSGSTRLSPISRTSCQRAFSAISSKPSSASAMTHWPTGTNT